jgi:hypothetical protein
MTTIEIITACILFLTFLAVVYYACETQKLRKATVEHNELQLRPCITLFLNSVSAKFHVFNIGKSTAIGIQFEEKNFETFKLKFDRYNHLEPIKHDILSHHIDLKSDFREEMVEGLGGNKDRILGFPFFDKKFSNTTEYVLNASYRNIDNQLYFSRIKIDCKTKNIELLDTGKNTSGK